MQYISLKTVDYEDPLVIVGFPSVGLVGSISSYHIIKNLDLEYIGYFEDPLFPLAMIVEDSVAYPPVRVYGRKDLIVFFSDVLIPSELIYPFVDVTVERLKDIKPKMVVTLEGFASMRPENVYWVSTSETIVDKLMKFQNHALKNKEDSKKGKETKEETKSDVDNSINNIDSMNNINNIDFDNLPEETSLEELELMTLDTNQNMNYGSLQEEVNAKIETGMNKLKLGMVGGISAHMMLKCNYQNIPAACLLVETVGLRPDPKAASIIIGVLNKEYDINANIDELIEEAEKIQSKLNNLAKEHAKLMTKSENPMYM
ncbi:proteasome assembly chaperone family protein [Methanococcus voltae]|uniref:proteasome assembly chaperone family protein n=1 Tax=Methanococcus voltae TaxID=2188 RepID=UPI001AE46B1A|nr:PAC2 family protein [Methanococcus voltae]MBP2172042.1 uncharacterized protein [Methanococcus voltae]